MIHASAATAEVEQHKKQVEVVNRPIMVHVLNPATVSKCKQDQQEVQIIDTTVAVHIASYSSSVKDRIQALIVQIHHHLILWIIWLKVKDTVPDVLLAKFNPSATTLLFASYLGGNGEDSTLLSAGLEVDRLGHIYLAGSTDSSNFPTTPGAFQSVKSGVGRDAFLTVIFAPNGDVNGDGCVSDDDLLAVIFAFGEMGNALAADLNGDGTVNDEDLLILLFNFGMGC